MHRWLALVVVVALSVSAIAQGPPGGRGAAVGPVAGNGVEVPGWWARLDNPKEPRTGLRFVPMGAGFRATVEPDFDAALRNADAGEGTVVITGSFHTVGDAMARLQVSPFTS